MFKHSLRMGCFYVSFLCRTKWINCKVCFLPNTVSSRIMTSELNSSLTSIDWLPQLGISTLRSGKQRVEKEKRRDHGRERDIPPCIPSSPSPSNSKGKPPHSYATLIAMAIRAAPEGKLSLNDIYTWISDTFPYYSRAGRGWKVGYAKMQLGQLSLEKCNSLKAYLEFAVVWNNIQCCSVQLCT